MQLLYRRVNVFRLAERFLFPFSRYPAAQHAIAQIDPREEFKWILNFCSPFLWLC